MMTPRTSRPEGRRQRRWRAGCVALVLVLTVGGLAADSKPTPVSVDLIPVPSTFDKFIAQTGNVRVKFSDGHTEMWTETGNAMAPKISKKGDIGWVDLDKSQIDVIAKNRSGRDKLVVRLHDGGRREFVMRTENPFIGNWSFAENETAVSIEVSGYHGPRSYLEFDLQTGQTKDQVIGYVSSETLPAWAKELVDE